MPFSVIDWGDPAALSAIDIPALKLPTDEGVKVMETLQLAPAASDVPHVLVCAKLAAPVPVRPKLVKLSGALPVLLS